jgi:hypothetical protein
VLSTAINGLDQDYANINAPAFASAVGGIPTAASLKGAQDARTSAIVGNINGPAATSWVPSDAPPALTAQRGADMKNALNFVRSQGTASGKLGGYSDRQLA